MPIHLRQTSDTSPLPVPLTAGILPLQNKRHQKPPLTRSAQHLPPSHCSLDLSRHARSTKPGRPSSQRRSLFKDKGCYERLKRRAAWRSASSTHRVHNRVQALCVCDLSESFVNHRSRAWPPPLASVALFWTLCWSCVQRGWTGELKAKLFWVYTTFCMCVWLKGVFVLWVYRV